LVFTTAGIDASRTQSEITGAFCRDSCCNATMKGFSPFGPDPFRVLHYTPLVAVQNCARTHSGAEGEDIVVGIESIIIMLIVGAIAGWLAGQIVRGFGFGLLWNIIIGIVGAFIGVWLLRQLGFMPFAGFIGSIVNATIGAVILLVIVGLIRR
jgi:uncharacterized membrane protein YeaQ/YmgE (transglycosylase-associated protein family)